MSDGPELSWLMCPGFPVFVATRDPPGFCADPNLPWRVTEWAGERGKLFKMAHEDAKHVKTHGAV